MATVEFSELLSEILAAAPACPLPTIVRTMRNAARELCEDSDCYRYTLENTVVVRNQTDVALSLPTGTTLHRPIVLVLDGKPLSPYSTTLLHRDAADWRDEPGEPRYWMRSTAGVNFIALAPVPVETYSKNGLKGEVALKPARDATGMDEVFMDRFQNPLIDGALATILSIPSAPWYAPDVASYHKQLFDRAKDDARAIADGDDTPKRRNIVYGGI